MLDSVKFLSSAQGQIMFTLSGTQSPLSDTMVVSKAMLGIFLAMNSVIFGSVYTLGMRWNTNEYIIANLLSSCLLDRLHVISGKSTKHARRTKQTNGLGTVLKVLHRPA